MRLFDNVTAQGVSRDKKKSQYGLALTKRLNNLSKRHRDKISSKAKEVLGDDFVRIVQHHPAYYVMEVRIGTSNKNRGERGIKFRDLLGWLRLLDI